MTILRSLTLLLSFTFVLAAAPADVHADSDEEVFVAPTFAVADPEAKTYRLQARVWVYEPEEDSMLRGAFVDALRAQLGVKSGSAEDAIFRKRVRMFLVDNERLKGVSVHLEQETRAIGFTGADGHAVGVLEFPYKEEARSELPLQYVVSGGDHVVSQTVPVLSKTGLAVVSDIDDTIKDSKVLDKKKLLEKTFMKPFSPVPGMAKAYQKLAKQGASFHYLSSSPWQLFGPLDEFRKASGFPDGTFHLRSYRPSSIGSNADLIGDSQPHKLDNLRQLFGMLGEREFILIGDAGEKDPEVYGTIAREHPGRVRAIYIREVKGADLSDARFAKAFEGVDVPTVVFSSPSKVVAKPRPTKKPEDR